MMKHTEWCYFLKTPMHNNLDSLLIEVMIASGIIKEVEPVILANNSITRYKISEEDAEKYNIDAREYMAPKYDPINWRKPDDIL